MSDKRVDEFLEMGRHRYGAELRSDPTSRFATGIFKGRSDMTWIKSGNGVFIEAKYGLTRFTTNSVKKDGTVNDKKAWTPHQRAFGKWVTLQNGSELFLCLMIGKDEPHLNPAKYKPRQCYLIPFDVALKAVEEREAMGRNSIPFRTGKGKNALPGCDLLFHEYALSWSDGGWMVPLDHPFRKFCD